MAFQGITFDGQNVTPKDDGALYGAHYGDGILDGCTMTISGDDLVIASGHFIAGGRVCQVDGATSVDLSGRTLTTGYIQVIMNYDLTQNEGSQWYTSFVESATTTFPALTTDDINGTGTLYQLELAVIQISGGNLTSIYSQLDGSRVITYDPIDGYKTYIFSGGGGGGVRILDSNNDVRGGFSVFGSGATFLYNEGLGIIFRPLGLNNASNQVRLTSDGQFIGGHLTNNNHRTSSQSIASGLNVQVASITSLDASGIYIASGFVTFAPSSSSAVYPRLTLTGTGSDHIYYSNAFSNSTASKSMAISGVVTGYTQYQLILNIAGGATASEALLYVVRIA